jgi:hypothetical protein
MIKGEGRSARREAFSSPSLSTTNTTWTALRLNPGLRGEKPANIRLSYGTALGRY